MTGTHVVFERENARRNALLKAHLEAGRWKAEAWALADSLSWALQVIERPAGTEMAEGDGGEYALARERLHAAQQGLAG